MSRKSYFYLYLYFVASTKLLMLSCRTAVVSHLSPLYYRCYNASQLLISSSSSVKPIRFTEVSFAVLNTAIFVVLFRIIRAELRCGVETTGENTVDCMIEGDDISLLILPAREVLAICSISISCLLRPRFMQTMAGTATNTKKSIGTRYWSVVSSQE